MSERNKDLVRRSWELPDNLGIIDEVYAPDLVWHDPDRDIKGIEEAKEFISTYKAAFPDLRTAVEDVIAEGDLVATRWTVRGTHQGEVEGFGPPTGRQVEMRGITIHRIEGGRIVEEWNSYDNLGVMQQLGLMPQQ
jgi:steroid delta-isomerase-like uncharacterized protein